MGSFTEMVSMKQRKRVLNSETKYVNKGQRVCFHHVGVINFQKEKTVKNIGKKELVEFDSSVIVLNVFKQPTF